MTDPILQTFDIVAKAAIGGAGVLVGVAGLFLSHAVYRLSRQQRVDSWLRTFNELHQEFWTDEAYGVVRAWLACEKSYREIVPILLKRRESPADLTPEEYRTLENLDKFFNFMARIVEINPEFFQQQDIWRKLFFEYWLRECTKGERPELRWYLRQFYGPVFERTGVSLDG